jgi:hypothetical protein
MESAQSRATRAVGRATFTVAVIAIIFVGCTRDQGIEGSTEDLTELTSDHAAMRVLAEGATDYDTFSAAVLDQELDFVCGAGGGPAPWQLCLVADDGVLAVVPFDGVDGLVARLKAPAFSEDVLIPLDTDQPAGVLHAGPGGSVDIEDRGEVVGGLSMP